MDKYANQVTYAALFSMRTQSACTQTPVTANARVVFRTKEPMNDPSAFPARADSNRTHMVLKKDSAV